MKIGKKISLMMMLLLVCCIGTTVFFSADSAAKNITHLTEMSIQENLHIYKSIVDANIEQQFSIDKVFVEDRRIIDMLSENELDEEALHNHEREVSDINMQLRSEVQDNHVIENIMIINTQGDIVLSGDESAIGVNVSEREYFKQTMTQKEKYVGASLFSKVSNEQVVPVCTPILNEQGEAVGMISSTMIASLVAEELDTATILGTQNTYPILFDQNGVMLVHRDKQYIGQANEDEHIKEAIAQLGTSTEEVIGELMYQSMISGDQRRMRYISLDQAQWLLAVTMDHEEMMQPVSQIRRVGIAMLMISLVIGAIATYFCSRSISNPLKQIAELIRKLAELDLQDSKDLNKLKHLKDEVGIMAEATATTTDTLKGVIIDLVNYAEYMMQSAEKVNALATHSSEESEQTVVIVEELSASMEEINASTEEVSSTVDHINENIKSITAHIARSGQLALGIANTSEKIKQNTAEEGQKVKANYEVVKNSMEAALKKAEVISQINLLVDSIKAITGQTNLLALNASIEAARAGEAGKGFGVVAHEIGSLATESAMAVNKIQDVINLVLEATDEMKENAQISLEFMEKQIEKSTQATTANAEIYIKDANEVYGALQNLEERSYELSQYSQVITEAINGIAIAIAENTEGVVNIASQTNNINDNLSEMKNQSIDNKIVAEELKGLTGKFKV